MEALRQLTHKEAEWKWMHEHNAAFEKIKRMVVATPVLKYYNPDEELTIQCDASDKGLGAALLQQGQPVAFASRALTDTETRYEKEMLRLRFLRLRKRCCRWCLLFTNLINTRVDDG